MPQRQNDNARAVVAAQRGGGGTPPIEGAQRALVAVARELDNRMAILSASAAAGVDAERFRNVALSTFTRTPALWTCDPISVARAIVEAGQLGLAPTGLMGGAYLVPRGDQATLLVGYRGLVMLAKRSGEVQRVEARVVRAKDAFDYGYGLEPYLRHVPSREADPGEFTGAYAVLFYRDGSRQFDYMSIAEIEDIRKRSSSPTKGPWVTDYAEMCKKTPLRRLMKLAPLTIEVATRLDEIDPEVGRDAPAAGSAQEDREQARIRDALQQALAAEYGATPAPDPAPAPTLTVKPSRPTQADVGAQAQAEEGTYREPDEPAPVAACGATNDKLEVGPCILPEGHTQREHEQADGTNWTQPATAAKETK